MLELYRFDESEIRFSRVGRVGQHAVHVRERRDAKSYELHRMFVRGKIAHLGADLAPFGAEDSASLADRALVASDLNVGVVDSMMRGPSSKRPDWVHMQWLCLQPLPKDALEEIASRVPHAPGAHDVVEGEGEEAKLVRRATAALRSRFEGTMA